MSDLSVFLFGFGCGVSLSAILNLVLIHRDPPPPPGIFPPPPAARP